MLCQWYNEPSGVSNTICDAIKRACKVRRQILMVQHASDTCGSIEDHGQCYQANRKIREASGVTMSFVGVTQANYEKSRYDMGGDAEKFPDVR